MAVAKPEKVMQYSTRNMLVRHNRRMRMLAAVNPEKYPSMEAVMTAALERGLTAIEKEEGLSALAGGKR